MNSAMGIFGCRDVSTPFTLAPRWESRRRKNLPEAASLQTKSAVPSRQQDCTPDLNQTDYSDFFPAALAWSQRAFAAAEILALPAALILRLLVGAFAAGFVFLIFAHRAF